MHYFAYGSNLLERRLQERVLDAEYVHTTCVSGWKLAFNKVSIDGSSKLNMVYTGDASDKVFGKVYFIPRAQKLNLDSVEGKGKGYHITRQRVAETNDFLFFYVADDSACVDDVQPYTWYIDLIIAGMASTAFPVQQRRFIEEHTTQDDFDEERTVRNMCAITGDYTPLLTLTAETDTDDTLDLIANYTTAMLVRKHLIVPKYYRQVDSVKMCMLQELLQVLNTLHNTNITMEFDLDCVVDNSHISVTHIVMCSLSIMTFIHEYGHALQMSGVLLTSSIDVEVDAQEWSHTIFFIAAPHMYLKAKNADKFYHDNVRMVKPFADADDTMPADNVLKNRFYKYFDKFVAHVKSGMTVFTMDDMLLISENHASLTRHVHKVLV